MAESGRLPAIKVGKQWRFPADQVDSWLQTQATSSIPALMSAPATYEASAPTVENGDLAALLPIDCVQLIQDSHADLLGVMLVITDMQGNPVTQVSNPCGLFTAVSEVPHALQTCIKSWHSLATAINIEPVFHKSHLGLFCARGLIRVGTELKGMVVAGCVAPSDWPPDSSKVQAMADAFGVPSAVLIPHLEDAYYLTETQATAVLSSLQRIANIVAHIVHERQELVGRLEAIANLTKMSSSPTNS